MVRSVCRGIVPASWAVWHSQCLRAASWMGRLVPTLSPPWSPKLPGSPSLASDLVISGVGNPPQTPADRGRVRMQVEVCVGTRVPCSLQLILSHQETVPHQPLLLPLGSLSVRCWGDK